MSGVIIESPLSGDFARNQRYARLCMLDSLRRGEAPFASHLLYTQCLDDRDPESRALGIAAGFAWHDGADLAAVYEDLGTSEGVLLGVDKHKRDGRRIVYRKLPPDWLALLDASDISATPGAER